MIVRLAFSVAAHLEPEVLLIDEVLAVGDLSFQRKCLGKMGDIVGQGRTVLFVSHQLYAIENLCSRTILIERGRILGDGPTSEVLEQYLGSVRELSTVPLAERTSRQGDGRLRFLQTWLENEHGRPIQVARSGAHVTIVASYRVVGEGELRNLITAFALYGNNHVQLTDLSNISTGDTFDGPIPREGEIRCEIPRLPLNAGLYVYNVIARTGPAVQDFIKEAGCFQVETGDYFGSGHTVDTDQGMLLVDHRWQLCPRPGQ